MVKPKHHYQRQHCQALAPPGCTKAWIHTGACSSAVEKVNPYSLAVADSAFWSCQGAIGRDGEQARTAGSESSIAGLARSGMKNPAVLPAGMMNERKRPPMDEEWEATTKKLALTPRDASLMMVEDGANWRVVEVQKE